MKHGMLPRFPYGAVYFRKSNPPRADWETDYKTASEDGMNIFRHWFLWSAIERAPGVFEWEEYDRQLDLAAEHGIKTIIAEMITVAPEWAYRRLAHARLEKRDGSKVNAGMHGSCVVGGSPGLCLDHADYRQAAGNFLHELATRYKDHPGLGGYDIWNECGYGNDTCFCAETAREFQAWLKEKYGDLRTLGEAWYRYSYAEWEDISPPLHSSPYPDVLDWMQFRIEHAYDRMRWRIEIIRSIDQDCAITAHGVAGSLTGMASGGRDDWRAAAEVESYGYTWGSSRHGDEPWKQFHAVDLVRASSRGKPFWHAEAYGGPLWMASNVLNKPRNEGRIAVPEDIRYWDMVSFMCGTTGLLFLRWRPLLDGPLFGAFGPYGMDGSRTPRSEMSAKVAKWTSAPEQEDLWKSRPIKGEVGIVYVPETQFFAQAQQGNTSFYSRSMQGAYRGFFDNNIQADWVRIDHIDEYDFLYLPYPVMLSEETAEKLRAWVDAGGTLVCEGCPGYFGDRGRVGTTQPNLGLDELFGVRESYVEFTPDLLDNLKFHVDGTPVWGGLFLQAYEPTTGTPMGRYDDGKVAAVDHTFGHGKTRLLGTMAGAGYSKHAGTESARFFAELMAFAGKAQRIRCNDPRITTRLHDGDGGTYLWVANPKRQAIPVRLELSADWGPFSSTKSLWGADAQIDGQVVTLTAGARDVAIIRLS